MPPQFDDLPPDPWADDPANDPSRLLPDFPDMPAEFDELSRTDTEEELRVMERLAALFEPLGYRGIAAKCGDCDDDHFYTFDLLKGNLQALLDGSLIPVHEPAYEPEPEKYLPWDYAVGYYDGYMRAQYELHHDGEIPPYPGAQGFDFFGDTDDKD